MSLWGKVDANTSAPKYKILDISPNTGVQLYGTRVVGIDVGEQQSNKKINHAGWNRVIRGTGGVTSITVTAGGTGYSNTDTLRVNNSAVAINSSAQVNCTATIVTNSTGGIVSATITGAGKGYPNTSVITTSALASGGGASAGSGATFTYTLGGRAGRVHTETLVAMGSMTSNGSSVSF